MSMQHPSFPDGFDIEALLVMALELKRLHDRRCSVEKNLRDGWYNDQGAARAETNIERDTKRAIDKLKEMKELLNHYPDL